MLPKGQQRITVVIIGNSSMPSISWPATVAYVCRGIVGRQKKQAFVKAKISPDAFYTNCFSCKLLRQKVVAKLLKEI